MRRNINKRLGFDPFGYPKKQGVSSRTSTITSMFAHESTINGDQSQEGRIKVLSLLGMYKDGIPCLHCSYCGGQAAAWDHLYAIVSGKRQTGYLNENNNLVPACTTCNSSKGNKSWRKWVLGRGYGPEHKERIRRLEAVDGMKREVVDYRTPNPQRYDELCVQVDSIQSVILATGKIGRQLKYGVLKYYPTLTKYNHIPEDMMNIEFDPIETVNPFDGLY